ncbi:MAG: type II secretion system protein GspK [Chromatiaceae bacterium]|nr:type II secretion system protein GspK [Chromatiaceae bacterium]
MSRPRARAPETQRGIALMLVLWVIALLVIIAAGMTADQRSETSLAANQIGAARFRALSDAAIAYAVYNLAAPANLLQDQAETLDSDLWVPDGAPRAWRFAGEDLSIAVTDEQSLIDLNQGSRELFSALLGALDLPVEEIDVLADAVLDWRDEDDLRQLNGAEDPDYAAAGRPYGAKDGPFDSVEELQQVLGFDRGLFLVLAPALTVAGSASPANIELAPPLVRAALEGISLEEVAQRIAEELASGSLVEPAAVNRGGPLYRIRVSRAGAPDAPTPTMEALVRVELGSFPPFRVLWRNFAPMRSTPSNLDEGHGL